jgi:hypothetical protein
MYTGMCDTDRVSQFLDFAGEKGWDPTLIGDAMVV